MGAQFETEGKGNGLAHAPEILGQRYGEQAPTLSSGIRGYHAKHQF